ncbi:hypothetical protein QTJ16_002844 [Diplocarpon rosae]|uniref:Uncharacterized protein n=1 Tax=Diplocarpon rosae TaxID=946125 RepID=A0AAD9T3J1_9HELO|nr:hypothetical protein QTJ16_002844 [Diplocarpon rosae]PBP26398.1 hypothetical protein BUE80_DR002768 [Diplocarpon rosae]
MLLMARPIRYPRVVEILRSLFELTPTITEIGESEKISKLALVSNTTVAEPANTTSGSIAYGIIPLYLLDMHPIPAPPNENRIMNATLYRLPFELRDMIWTFCLDSEWTGQMPALVKALRCDKNLHAECMRAWYKEKHTYVLHSENNWSFLDMPEKVISTITKVKIIIDEHIALHPLLRWSDMEVLRERFPMSCHDLSLTAALAPSVTSVTLDCRPTSTNLYFWFPQKFTQYLSGFSSLTHVAVTCPIKPSAKASEGGIDEEGMVDSEWQESTMSRCVETANEALGVLAKLGAVYADGKYWYGRRVPRKFVNREVWIWVAEEGRTLNKQILPPGLAMERDKK